MFVSQYYTWLSLLSTKTSVNLYFQFQKMLRLYKANRRLMFKLTNIHRESKQRQATAWMIVTIPPSWLWILVLRTLNFEFFENCIMCRGSVDLLKVIAQTRPRFRPIWPIINCFIFNDQVKIKEIVKIVSICCCLDFRKNYFTWKVLPS